MVIHLTRNTNHHYNIIILRRENPFGEEQLFLNNTEVLYASHFNESRPTKFIVHGFSDTGNEGWIRDLIGGGSTWILRRNLRIFLYYFYYYYYYFRKQSGSAYFGKYGIDVVVGSKVSAITV